MTFDPSENTRRAHATLQRLCSGDARKQPPNVLVVAAHPDDEVIGAGILLSRTYETFWLVHITDGSPEDQADARAAGCQSAEEYARLRAAELGRAMALAGIPQERRFRMEIRDQRASMHLEAIAACLAEIADRIVPELILTHPYEGGHPDHDAAALAVCLARELMSGRGPHLPALAEFTSYHAGQNGSLVSEFLPASSPVSEIAFTDSERILKRRMFECFGSQQQMLRRFPVSAERFRPAPAYDFMLPPHPGALYYENFAWGLSGAQWRSLARIALDSVGGKRCR